MSWKHYQAVAVFVREPLPRMLWIRIDKIESGVPGQVFSPVVLTISNRSAINRCVWPILINFSGAPKDYCIIGLLPNYLEKGNSSLVKMVHDLISLSSHPDSGFYLYDFERLGNLILQLESQGQKTLLLGVTFALMDFADQFALLKQTRQCSSPLMHTVIMDTGGMKGRKKEMTRGQVHDYLA